MKIRSSFVSNSSSASFIIHCDSSYTDMLEYMMINAGAITLYNTVVSPTEYPHEIHDGSLYTKFGWISKDGSISWYITSKTEDTISFETSMTNFRLDEFIVYEASKHNIKITIEEINDDSKH